MRSVIKHANPSSIKQVVNQQFELAERIIAAGLVPIVEPEVDIHCPEKAQAEDLLKAAILDKLDGLSAGQLVMLKLTLPDQADLYADFVSHPAVVRVVALSGGYSQAEADDRLRKNHGIVASFSRALVEGLTVRAIRCGVQRHARCIDSKDLRSLQYVERTYSPWTNGGGVGTHFGFSRLPSPKDSTGMIWVKTL